MIKPDPNHKKYLQVLDKMTPEQRLSKAFELSDFSKDLFLHGLKKRFPEKSPEEIHQLYLEKIKNGYTPKSIRYLEVLSASN